ncbi:DUF5709 domain-containing protein [Streptomyces genisteinicus]|uniref:DUF5709 domain-containing protein n=1 Tax=Streptomyces genisteinicus TaxID=2768068 RepID=A0A7H0HMS3_9ACTN|nr:DUF5709 domain-containing protein [Streptomyces genisteinicus]QNP61839.1 hypothetical protein IAG43_02150 [Streptomyces genisteinicus]
MSDDTTAADPGRSDDVYQPGHSDAGNRPSGELDPENVIGERSLDDTMEEGYSPPERPLGVNRHGTTGSEAREGETLDDRLAQEAPDTAVPDGDGIGDLPGGAGEPAREITGDARAGRIAPADDPAPRRPAGTVARDVGIDGGAASAEEAAMHVEAEPGEDGAGAGDRWE